MVYGHWRWPRIRPWSLLKVRSHRMRCFTVPCTATHASYMNTHLISCIWLMRCTWCETTLRGVELNNWSWLYNVRCLEQFFCRRETQWSHNANAQQTIINEKMQSETQTSPRCHRLANWTKHLRCLIRAYSLNYIETWRHPQNRKYVAVRGWPNKSYRQHVQKIWWNLDVWVFEMCVYGADRQINVQTRTRWSQCFALLPRKRDHWTSSTTNNKLQQNIKLIRFLPRVT